MRQRLPADLKAFLKIYRSHGNFFNDLEFLTPESIYSKWHFRTEIGFDTMNFVRFDSPSGGPLNDRPSFCDARVVIFASETVYDTGYDLSTGKVVEVYDCDLGWTADSLAEFLNGMASAIEKGKIISTFYMPVEDRHDADRYRKPLLDSRMWSIYELPPDVEQGQ